MTITTPKVIDLEGGIRFRSKIYPRSADITTSTHKVSLQSKWVVSLPWWLLNQIQERTTPWAPHTLKPFWALGWSHTKCGFMRSSFSTRKREDETVNQHHNLWVIHLCDLCFIFPFMFREDQDILVERMGKNDQQRWQADFMTFDLMFSASERADKEALALFKDHWLGTPVCHRLEYPWRSWRTWTTYDHQLPPVRKPPPASVLNSVDQGISSEKFMRRWSNDLNRGLGESL